MRFRLFSITVEYHLNVGGLVTVRSRIFIILMIFFFFFCWYLKAAINLYIKCNCFHPVIASMHRALWGKQSFRSSCQELCWLKDLAYNMKLSDIDFTNLNHLCADDLKIYTTKLTFLVQNYLA